MTDERTLVGESLAGLFVVETLLLEPALFTHYVALDPSLWWNRERLVDSADRRLAGFDPSPRTVHLVSSEVREIARATARLASRFRRADRPGLSWDYQPRPDLGHHNIFRRAGPAALAAALR